jgi:PhnB protein
MSIEPWLSVPDGTRAVGFYVEAFGAAVLERLEGDHGEVDIARFAVAGGHFWILLLVPDPEAALSRAVAAGAVEVAAVHEEHGWLTGRVTDPFGFDWELSRELG